MKQEMSAARKIKNPREIKMLSCVEKIDMELMKLILANFDSLWEEGLIAHKDENYNKVDDKEMVRTIYTKFYNRHDSNGFADMKYKPSKNNPEGRVFAPYSLQTITRCVRHTISTGLIDLDMKNCHPTLLKKEVMDKNSIPCPTLTEYVEHRDQVLKALETQGMTREEAKEKVLAIINGQAVEPDDDQWFFQLKGEMREITNRVHILYPRMYERAVKDGGNILHRALHYELCRLERQKLDAMVAFCKKNKLKVAALCHDGLMLYKDTTRNYEAICDELTKVCGIEVVIKEFDEKITPDKLPKTEIPQVELVDDAIVRNDPCEPYAEMKKRMEQTFFKTLSPYRYMEERNGVLYEWKHKEFEQAYHNLYCYSYDKKEGMCNRPFPNVWMADPNIRTYHHFEFNPAGTPKDVYNQFKGFNADRLGGNAMLGQEGLEVWKEHLMVMCNFDQAGYDYQEKWLAWGIQRPERKIGVAIVYMGEQGSGKGSMAEYYGCVIIGREYMVETSSINDIVTDGFNASTKNKLLVIFDESSADEANYDKMKNKITGTLQPLRQKYVDTKTNVPDHSNMMFLSNNRLPVIIKPDERRHMIYKTSNKYCTMNKETPDEEKKAYFDRFHAKLSIENPCPHTAAAIIQHLRSIDLTGFHPQMDRPLTKAYHEVKAASIPNELKFIKDYSDEICAKLPAGKREEYIFYREGKSLYRDYIDWNKDYNPRGQPVGKNTLFDRWRNYSFITPSNPPEKARIPFFQWSYKALLKFWDEQGFDVCGAVVLDEAQHKRLLAQQID